MPPTQPTQPSAPETPPSLPNDNSTLMAILAYLGPLVIVPFLMAKDNPFVHFHIRQGMVVFAIELVIYLLSGMLFYNLFIFQILSIANIGCLILSIIGIVHVTQKRETALPVVGHLAKHLPF